MEKHKGKKQSVSIANSCRETKRNQPTSDLPRLRSTKSVNFLHQNSRYLVEECTDNVEEKNMKPYRLTPIIVTANENILTEVDVRALLEMGLSIIRFRMTVVSRSDKLKLLRNIDNALAYMCEKYDTSAWPLATCLDLPNATIRTGYIEESLGGKVTMKENSIVTITSDIRYWDKCTASLVYIDDSFTIQHFTPGLELTMLCGIGLHCIESIDKKTAKFKVTEEGEFQSNSFVCLRGVRYHRPPLMKRDLELLKFAQEHRFDVISVYTVRYPSTIIMIKKLLGDNYKPLILSGICDQQGLDSIDDIINVSDGIILARDFLFYQMVEKNRVLAIQMHLAGKCKAMGKAFFLSGHILQHALEEGTIYSSELSDVTNGVIQGAGFLLRHYGAAKNIITALNLIDNICREVESTVMPHDLFRLIDEIKSPANAAEAAVMGCAIMAMQMRAAAIIVHTVSGKTAIQVSSIAPHIVIIALTRDAHVARKLQVRKGIIALVYNKPPKYPHSMEIKSRVEYAMNFCVKMEILQYQDLYVTLRKSNSECSFCDHISSSTVSVADTEGYQYTSLRTHNEVI